VTFPLSFRILRWPSSGECDRHFPHGRRWRDTEVAARAAGSRETRSGITRGFQTTTALADAARRRLGWATRDRSLAPLNGDDRPTIAGASLLVVNPTTGETATLAMPAAGWTQLPAGFRYSDRTLARGPVRNALIRSGRLAKVVAMGSAIGFTLDEPMQGSLGAVFTTGGRRYCTLFGGRVRRDAPGRFVASKAPPPPVCPGPGG